MVDPVERRGQVSVEHPPPLRGLALAHLIDGLDGVVAATAGPEAIGLRLEPCLPLGFQRVDDLGLVAPGRRSPVSRAGAASRWPWGCTPA